MSNGTAGANGSRFGLRIGSRDRPTPGAPGNGSPSRPAPTGCPGSPGPLGPLSSAQITVTDASGATRTLNVPASSGWTRRELADFTLAGGAATITVRASSSGGGYLYADQLELVKTSGDEPQPPTQRYEAETAPAVCQGTIDANHGAP